MPEQNEQIQYSPNHPEEIRFFQDLINDVNARLDGKPPSQPFDRERTKKGQEHINKLCSCVKLIG